MLRRSFTGFVVTSLAVAALLVSAQSASAQRWSRGFGVGYSPGTGVNFGYGNNYGYGYGSPYYGGYYGPGQYSYGRSFYPGYYNSGWSTPGYTWSENNYYNNWSTPSYSNWSTPSYYSEGTQPDYYNSSYAGESGFNSGSYGALSSPTDNRVLITTQVPPNAEIWFDGQKTSQMGSIRSFISPPLQSDQNFVYHVRVTWTENGQQVEKDRKIDVHPGDRLFVTFMKPRSEGMEGMGSGQSGMNSENRGNDRSMERQDRTLNDTEHNRQQNADRAPENRTQPSTPNTNTNPAPGADRQPQTPNNLQPNNTTRPPE